MSQLWPRLRLGAVLRRSEETIELKPDQEYREVTVRLWGKGVVLRGTITGAEVAAQRRFSIRKGQFILSRIDARNGAFGLVPSELDGAIVSNDFPVFTIDERQLFPAFLGWMSRTAGFVEMCRRASEGTTNRVQLREDKFLSLELPLPSVDEQRRIISVVERIDALADEAVTLRRASDHELESLCRAVLSHDYEAKLVPMRDLVRLRQPDVVVVPDEVYQFAGVYSFGRGVFRGQQKSGMEFAYRKLTRLKAGDFTYPKLMAWEGALGVVPAECDGCVVSTEFPVFEVLEERIYPEVLDVHFKDPHVWLSLSGASTGTNVRRRRLNPADFLGIMMPVPSHRVQKQVRGIRSEIDRSKDLRGSSLLAVEALRSAVLNQAFRGGF